MYLCYSYIWSGHFDSASDLSLPLAIDGARLFSVAFHLSATDSYYIGTAQRRMFASLSQPHEASALDAETGIQTRTAHLTSDLWRRFSLFSDHASDFKRDL
jgi:hypothetical protein